MATPSRESEFRKPPYLWSMTQLIGNKLFIANLMSGITENRTSINEEVGAWAKRVLNRPDKVTFHAPTPMTSTRNLGIIRALLQ